MASLILRTEQYFDGTDLHAGRLASIAITDDRIAAIRLEEPSRGGAEARTTQAPRGDEATAEVIDATGLTVLPGLIDAHFHPVSSTFDVASIDRQHPSLRALDARQHLESALLRGFTTVRDAGGGDIGLVRALERGLIQGPRLLLAGKAISQTGGHGDMRPGDSISICGCGYSGALSQVVDGVDEMRRAVREQLRQGADHIKLFVSGGVLSPTDPIWMDQFTDEEIGAAVQEAATRRTYVMAHAHTAEAVRRCVRNGVRSVEHGTLMDRQSADEVAEAGAFVVPTLAVVDVLRESGDRLPRGAAEKLAAVADRNCAALSECVRAGVKLGFGTDLFGELRARQADEFKVRGRIQSPVDVLRSATRVNAELVNQTGQIGTLAAGALADVIGVEGNPLENVQVLAEPERYLKLVIKGGRIIVNRLSGRRQ